jgi:hypothetical protein
MLLVLATCITGSEALAQERANRPSQMIRFRGGEHPRLWITAADLPAIRKRCAPGGSHEREFKRMKELADSEIATGGVQGPARGLLYSPVTMAFLYLVTGERRYAEVTKGILREGRAERQAGVALDWIMNRCDLDDAEGVPVTPEELRELVKAIASSRWCFRAFDRRINENPFISPWRNVIPGTLYLGIALHDEDVDAERFDTALDWVMDWVRNTWIPATNRRSRGIYYPGFDYYRYATASEARAAVAWKVATGEDLFETSVQLREFVRYAFFQRDPRTDTWVHYEQGRGARNVSQIMPVYSHGLADPTVRAMAQYLENRRITEDGFWRRSVRGNWSVKEKTPLLWERILWFDPKAREVDPLSLPTAAHWPGNGYSSFRSGWGPDDTILFFIAGDHVSEHQRLYQGHFAIYRKGWLATTSGSYDSCFKPDAAYFTRSIANNCLLVRDDAEQFWDGYGKLNLQPNDGGQYLFGVGAVAWGGDWRERKPNDVWDVADTVAFASKPLYDYVAGDMTNAYRRTVKDPVMKAYEQERITFEPSPRPDKLTRCTRQIVYLKPDLFVMFDRVDSVDPQFTKTWLLHTMNRPEIDGERTMELPAEGAEEFDGSFYSAEHREGKLMVRRLLPERAVVRRRGGKGFDAWTDGRNWPKGNGQRYGWEYAAWWRIEEEPMEPRTDDVFLHVLYACDAGTPAGKMPKCDVISDDTRAGVKVRYLDRDYEITFRRDGGRTCAGHIKATQNGRVLLDEDLANKVIPTFEVKPAPEDR